MRAMLIRRNDLVPATFYAVHEAGSTGQKTAEPPSKWEDPMDKQHDQQISRAVGRALVANHSRAVAQGVILNHSRAVARGLIPNHSRAVARGLIPNHSRAVARGVNLN